MHLVKTNFIEKFRCAQYNFTHIPGIIYFHMGSFSEKTQQQKNVMATRLEDEENFKKWRDDNL